MTTKIADLYQLFLHILALTLVMTCAWTAPSARAHSDDLNAFFEEAWQADLAANPLLASSLGDPRFNAVWPDLSTNAIAATHASDRKFLARARRLKANQTDWDEHDQLNLALFEQSYQQRVTMHRYRDFLQPMNQRGGIQSADQIAQQLRFQSKRDYDDWIARLRSFDTFMDQTITLMRMGITEKRTHPKVIMQRLPEQIKAQLVAVEDSGFYAPFKNMPPSISAADQKSLQSAGRRAIDNIVIPSYRKLLTFFNEQYLPACRDTVGAWALPDGANFYAQRARNYTTTELTPDEIHDIGLAEVKRIRSAMQEVITQVEFEGSFNEFLEFLRTDEQFYFDNPDDLLREYRATSKRIDPQLVKLFKRLPRMPYGVKPIPDAIAPDTTTAYYSRPAADGSRAGYYFVNLYRPEVRPKYEIEVLTVHEAMPGHHLQIALAQELGDLPKVRRFKGYTVCTAKAWAVSWDCTRIPTRASVSSPMKCGAPCGWSWTRACTTRNGPVIKPSNFSLKTPPKRNTTSLTRSIATSPGPVRRWPTKSAS
jgi:uncharacterized protein (DUF885 family)